MKQVMSLIISISFMGGCVSSPVEPSLPPPSLGKVQIIERPTVTPLPQCDSGKYVYRSLTVASDRAIHWLPDGQRCSTRYVEADK